MYIEKIRARTNAELMKLHPLLHVESAEVMPNDIEVYDVVVSLCDHRERVAVLHHHQLKDTAIRTANYILRRLSAQERSDIHFEGVKYYLSRLKESGVVSDYHTRQRVFIDIRAQWSQETPEPANDFFYPHEITLVFPNENTEVTHVVPQAPLSVTEMECCKTVNQMLHFAHYKRKVDREYVLQADGTVNAKEGIRP